MNWLRKLLVGTTLSLAAVSAHAQELSHVCKTVGEQLAYPVKAYFSVVNARGERRLQEAGMATATLLGKQKGTFYFATARHVAQHPWNPLLSEERATAIMNKRLEQLLAEGESLLQAAPALHITNGEHDVFLDDNAVLEQRYNSDDDDLAIMQYRPTYQSAWLLRKQYFLWLNGYTTVDADGRIVNMSPGHRLNPRGPLPVIFPDYGRPWTGRELGGIRDPHLMQVRYDDKFPRAAVRTTKKLLRDAPQRGENVCVIGWENKGYTTRFGRVLGSVSNEFSENALVVAVETHPGMSGGPVLGVRDGQPVLYGIIVGSGHCVTGEPVTFAVSARHIDDGLRNATRRVTPRH